MTEQEKYKKLCQRLMEGLRLETTPVAVFFSTNPPENVPAYKGGLKACTMLDLSRLEGKVFYTVAKNHTCKNGQYYLGMSKAFAGLKTGDWNAGKYPDKGRSMYASPAVFRRTLPFYPRVDQETVNVISYAPLDNCPISIRNGGGVVVVICNPKQAMYLARSATYHMGGVVQGITGPSTCAVIMGGPFQYGQMYHSLGCYGGRLYVKVKTEETFIGFPIEMLDNMVEAVENILRDRPDLNNLIQEGVGQYHEATPEEIKAQVVKGDMGKIPD